MSEAFRLQLIERPNRMVEVRAIGYAHATAPLPFAPNELAGLLADGEYARVGQALYATLFPEGEVRDALAEALAESRAARQALTVQLRFDAGSPTLPCYPWELIHDGRSFLVADGALALARSLDCAQAAAPAQVEGRLRVLVASPRPVDLEEPGERGDSPVLKALDELRKRGLLHVDVLSPPTYAALGEALSHTAYQVVHLDGTAACRPGGDATPHLIFEDEAAAASPVSAETLHNALFLSKAALAVLTPPPHPGGEALRWAEGEGGETPPLQLGAAALAPALVRAGVPAVVAMQRALTAEQIERFCRQLYSGLAELAPLGAAMVQARGQLLPAESARFAPVVYLQDGEGTGRLFVGQAVAGSPEPLRRVPRAPGRISAGYRAEPVFVDRAQAVAECLHILAQPGARGALWGLGGVGKTAVAREVVRRGAWRFGGGIIWLGLQGGRSLAAVLAEIADFFRALKQLAPVLEEARRQVSTLLAERTAGAGDVLLVLDNYEDVAADLDLQVFLAGLPPGVHVLATTRVQPAGLDGPGGEGWRPVELRAMAAPDIERILRCKAAAQRLAVAAADEPLLGEIAGLLDGYPLGVDLVVSLARSCPWAHIRDELRAQPPPPLVATLRTTVAQGLSDEQRRVGARLSVLRGPFPEAAIARVAGTAQWLPHVKRLRELSLLSFDGANYAFDVPARDYLCGLLAPEEARACHEQAYRYFAGRKDIDGLVEAYRHAMAAGHHQAARTLLRDTLLDALLDAGRFRQLLGLLDAALAEPEAFDERFLLARAGVQRILGRLPEALESLERLLAVPDLAPPSRALALHERGRISYDLDDEEQGDHQRALDLYGEALAICEELAAEGQASQVTGPGGPASQPAGPPVGPASQPAGSGGLDRATRRWLDGEMASLLQDIAVVYQYALAGPADLAFARQLYAASAGFWKRLRDPISRATSDKQRAEILRTGSAEDREEAKRIYRQVMQALKRKGLRRAYGDVLLQLGKIYQDEHSFKHALRRFQEYEEIQHSLGLEREEAMAWKQQGEVWQEAGYRGRSVRRAVELHSRALERLVRYHDRWSRRTVVATLLRRGEGWLELRMPGEAKSDFYEALSRSVAMGTRGDEFDLRRLSQTDRQRLAWAYCALAHSDEPDAGAEFHDTALAACRALGAEGGVDDCRAVLVLPGWAVHHKGVRRET
ncbi:MAG TPA: CHAT domain-containing protein [Anaerolineae bacterium]|nr:CHAT domain-containing protein [Anaerolineae bacterium]HOR00240.1 CHAT domain-containing protein [Anaerolineae bacterium]HPL27762.1 CHAT domain-containing protein [Anaerolineae bacterium]